jgi:hypothetical protein
MNGNNNYSKVDPNQSLDDRDAASKARVAAGKLRRERRNKAKELKKKYNEIQNTLDNTADKRELKEQYKAALLDIDTSLESNKSGAGSTIQDDGIDNIDSSADGGGGGGGGGGGDVEFNGSVLICIDGSPYYIDIPYDSDTGPYAQSEGANFPISAP